jgi:hypothetical protein
MRRIKHLIAAAFLGALVQSSSTSSGQNIVFDRQSGGFVIAQATTETSAVFRSDRKNNRDSTDGISSHKVFLRGLTAESITRGSHAMGHIGPMVGEISLSEFEYGYVPEHELAAGHIGLCEVKVKGASAQTVMETKGYLQAFYSTSPGKKVMPGKDNRWATMSVFMQFLAAGPPRYLGVTTDYSREPDLLERFFRGDGFRQGIRVGDSSLDLIHLGDGIFNTFGTIAASSEKSRSQHRKDYFIIDIGSVNRLITAQQRVPLDSVEETAVAVELLQLSRTAAARFPIGTDPGGIDYMVGKDAWIWGFSTVAWFFAEDLLDPDDPSEDEGGGTGGGGSGGGPG